MCHFTKTKIAVFTDMRYLFFVNCATFQNESILCIENGIDTLFLKNLNYKNLTVLMEIS